jgi:transcriptional regulator with XRE-family HTH domain
MEFGHSIVRRITEEHGINQKEMSEKVGVSHAAVSKWAKMGLETPKNADLMIAKAFGMELYELYAPIEIRALLKEYKRGEGDRDKIAFLRYRNLKPKDKALVDELMLRLHASTD